MAALLLTEALMAELTDTSDPKVQALVLAVVALLFDTPAAVVAGRNCGHYIKVAISRNAALCAVCRAVLEGLTENAIHITAPEANG